MSTSFSFLLILALSLAVSHGTPIVSRWHYGHYGNSRKMETCTSNETATYNVTIHNLMTADRFPSSNLPETGLLLSPPSFATHSNRVSILTARGYASPAIEAIAETGNNSLLISALTELNNTEGGGVRSLAAATGPVPASESVSLQLTVDCNHSFVSGVAMIAPSPDWIVQFANMNLMRRHRHWTGATSMQFVESVKYGLTAYDAGTDDGAELTDPSDPSLDMPTEPKINIAPLVEDETDRFGGKVVAIISIRRIM